jgi:hypothetical protein
VLIALLPVLVLINGNRAVKDAVAPSQTESAPLPPATDPLSQDKE